MRSPDRGRSVSFAGSAWVLLWAFHAISPHVTGDTRFIVHDFRISNAWKALLYMFLPMDNC